jgi:hypothetical protein
MTFKPSIPDESRRILEESVRRAQEKEREASATGAVQTKPGTAVSTGKYFQQPVLDRLSRQLKPTPRRIVTLPSGETYVLASTNGAIPQPPKRLARPSSQVAVFVDRLVGEYQERERRRQEMADRFYAEDPVTGFARWQPRIGPPPPGGVSMPSQPVRRSDGTVGKPDIVDVLYLKDKKIKDRLAALCREKKRKEDAEVAVLAQATALPSSDSILKEALERAIEEMFRLLYVSTTSPSSPLKQPPPGAGSVHDDLRRAQNLSKASESLQGIDSLQLDLALVQPDMMIPEVTALLIDVCRERQEQEEQQCAAAAGARPGRASSSAQPQSLPTSLLSFRLLVKRCLARRDGTGKSYLYAPKKKPEVAMQMVLDEQRHETFKPFMNPASAAAMAARGREGPGGRRVKGYKIENQLSKEGAKVQARLDVGTLFPILPPFSSFLSTTSLTLSPSSHPIQPLNHPLAHPHQCARRRRSGRRQP